LNPRTSRPAVTIHPKVCPLQITLVKQSRWSLNPNRGLKTMGRPKFARKRRKQQSPGARVRGRQNRLPAGVDAAAGDGVAAGAVRLPTRAARRPLVTGHTP
jgi:hypothetical protein